MATNRDSRSTSRPGSKGNSGLGAGLKQGELFTGGSSWLSKFTARRRSQPSGRLRQKQPAPESREDTSATPLSDDSASKD